MTWRVLDGDALTALRTLPEASVHCCVTSPPYFGLRDYGIEGQIGLEPTPAAYVEALVAVMREVRRVLRDDGTLWLNLGDSYARDAAKGQHKPGDSGKEAYVYDRGGGRASATLDLRGSSDGVTGRANRPDGVRYNAAGGLKPKDLIGIPWMVAFALRADGWYLRSDIVWAKPNAMPESVGDRPTKAHEYVFLLSKSERYHFDADAVREEATCDRVRGPALHPDLVSTNGNAGLSRRQPLPVRNIRSVWSINTFPFPDAHFAVFPPALPERCILAGCPPDGIVLDPFAGSGTTGLVATRLGRGFIGIELNPTYAEMARRRILDDCPLFNRLAEGA